MPVPPFPIPRIKVLDFKAFGQKVIEWAKDPDSRPKDLDEFKAKTAGAIEPLPDWIKGLQFVQSNMEVLLIRLPPAELIEDTERLIREGGAYQLPDFYEKRLVDGQITDNLEFFEHRVGDYTLAHCQ